MQAMSKQNGKYYLNNEIALDLLIIAFNNWYIIT